MKNINSSSKKEKKIGNATDLTQNMKYEYEANRFTYSWGFTNQNVAGCNVVMKYPEIL